MSLKKPLSSQTAFRAGLRTGAAPGPEVALPPPQTRWVASRKLAVVAAIRGGKIARADARARYALSEEELCAWERM